MSKEKNIKTYELFKQDRFLGILVHLLTGLFCEFRNNTPDEQLQSGMGDIFIKLAR